MSKGGVAGSHALWTLDGLGELDHDTHQLALLKPDPILKRNAIRAIPNTDEGMQLFFDAAVVQAKDPLVRLAAFSKLAHFPNRERVEMAAKQLAGNPDNEKYEWLQVALRACGATATKRGKATFDDRPEEEAILDAPGLCSGLKGRDDRPEPHVGHANFGEEK